MYWNADIVRFPSIYGFTKINSSTKEEPLLFCCTYCRTKLPAQGNLLAKHFLTQEHLCALKERGLLGSTYPSLYLREVLCVSHRESHIICLLCLQCCLHKCVVFQLRNPLSNHLSLLLVLTLSVYIYVLVCTNQMLIRSTKRHGIGFPGFFFLISRFNFFSSFFPGSLLVMSYLLDQRFL